MDAYSRNEAAKLLGVSRQTVYRRVKADADRYTKELDSGERVITLQGLEELRAAIHGKEKRFTSKKSEPLQTVTSEVSQLRMELERERERYKAALDDVTRCNQDVSALQYQVDTANKRIDSLESEKAMLYELLRDAQRKIPDAQPAKKTPGPIARLMAWIHPGKEEPVQPEPIHTDSDQAEVK